MSNLVITALNNSIFNPTSMTNRISLLPQIPTQLLTTFFPQSQGTASPNVEFEVYKNARTPAKVVGYTEKEGKEVEMTGATRKIAALPRIKEKVSLNVYDLHQYVLSTASEYLSLDAAQRRESQEDYVARNVAIYTSYALTQLQRRISFRHELMAAQAVSTGKITPIAGDLEPFNIDFEFVNGENLVTLTAGDRWGQSTAKPNIDFAAASRFIQQKTGFPASDVVLSYGAWEKLLSTPNVLTLLDTNNLQAGRLNANSAESNWDFKGSFGGINVWLYGAQYGASTDFLPANSAVFVSRPAIPGRVFFSRPLNLNQRQLAPVTVWQDIDPKGNSVEVVAESVAAPIIQIPGAIRTVIVSD
jgi:hypothetical protein